MQRKVRTVVAIMIASALAQMAPLAAASALAQQPSAYRTAQFPAPSPPKKRSYTDKGIISAVHAKGLTVIAKKEVWVLVPQQNCKVYVTGTAEPDFLKAGMLVRLYGQFDKRLKPSQPIQRLDIVSPSTPNLAFGVFVDTLPPEEEVARAQAAAEAAAAEAEAEANSEATPPDPMAMPGDPMPNDPKTGDGANANGDPNAGAGVPCPDQPAADVDDPNNAGNPDDAEFKPAMVVGQLKLLKDGELVVSAGGRVVRAELADDAEIRVFLSDFRLASRGDPLKFRSEYFEKGTAYPTELTIELTRPLTARKKPTGAAAAKK